MENEPGIFRFHVSLHITHPELEPDLITERLGLAPTSLHRKGEKDTQGWGTEKSPHREFVRERSKWFHMFAPVGDGSLDACMRRALDKLKEQQEFLDWIHSTGGRVKFHVNLYPPVECERPFDYEMIAELRKWGLGFAIDFFPERD